MLTLTALSRSLFLQRRQEVGHRRVWTDRLADGGGAATILAEDDAGLVGFVHVVLDEDAGWGSLIDNLHVWYGRKGSGIGRVLMVAAARAATERADRPAMYLWVLDQNAAAQGFYDAMGGVRCDRASVLPPGGVASRLTDDPTCIRYWWPDATQSHDRSL